MKTRIAVAGAGLIGRSHMALLQDHPDAMLAAVVDPAPQAQAWAAQSGVPWHASLDALLAHSRPDAVVLATPNALHVPQALQCLQAGLAVLVEKPVATSVKEAWQLVQATEQCQGRLLVGHHRAHSAIMQRATQAIREGLLGRLVGVMGSAVFYKPDDYFEQGPWRTRKGGGPILINLIHEIHNLRMLCGEIVSVQAMASNAIRQFEVEDTVVINFRFASGALGSFMLSDTAASARSWEQTSQENPAYPSYDDEDCYVIAGTRGSLSVPTMRIKSYAQEEDRSWWKPFEATTLSLDRHDPLARQMAHFVALTRGQVAPLVSARDGLVNLQVTEAIGQAIHTGARVDLSFPPLP